MYMNLQNQTYSNDMVEMLGSFSILYLLADRTESSQGADGWFRRIDKDFYVSVQ